MKYIFWIAAALVGYSYLAYPAWLWLRSLWSPRPVRRGFVESSAAPTVSAVMVVRNEESVIARKLDNLLTLDYPQEKLDVVVVSDGSSGEFRRPRGRRRQWRIDARRSHQRRDREGNGVVLANREEDSRTGVRLRFCRRRHRRNLLRPPELARRVAIARGRHPRRRSVAYADRAPGISRDLRLPRPGLGCALLGQKP